MKTEKDEIVEKVKYTKIKIMHGKKPDWTLINHLSFLKLSHWCRLPKMLQYLKDRINSKIFLKVAYNIIIK